MKEYELNVDFDKKTLKVKKFPRCGNDVFSENAEYCKICGLPLKNKCVEYDSFGTAYANGHTNTPNARFCEICGQPTSYSIIYEILEDWQVIRGFRPRGTSTPIDDGIPF